MTNVRIRKAGNADSSGGLKFRRNLNIDWSIETELTSDTIVGNEGALVQAITFGDPYSSDARGPISIADVQFQYFKLLKNVNLESSSGLAHKVVDGPFFKLRESNFTPAVNSLASLGAWVNNLPSSSHLNMTIGELVPDGVYQVRCIFVDGKNKVSPKLFLGTEGYEINYNRQKGCVVAGIFTANDRSITIRIASKTIEPPHINAVVLRRIGYNPRTTASLLRTISDLKS